MAKAFLPQIKRDPIPYVQLNAGDSFCLLEEASRRVYVVAKVDHQGGVVCHEEEEIKKGVREINRSLHIFCRIPLEAKFERGAIRIIAFAEEVKIAA